MHHLDRRNCTEMYNEQLNGLMDHVRLRGIIESAREQHLYELARYKVDRFLNDMEKEFHSNPSEMFLKGLPVNHVNSLKFAISELERAKLTHGVNASDPPEETPGEWEYVSKELATMEVVSPYANRSDSQIAAQIKAHLERELGRS